ncbi:hypothetical protein HQ533_01415 [Candidatus Woesearchaeota archaeon]|nr:hypothetical protein [Candidatus Woesearchaeota archaeon]
MIRSRKGQGLSINTIIIAAIGILVLVILALLVARSGSHVSDNTECIKKAAVCQKTCDEDKQVSTYAGEFCTGSLWCCRPV